MTSVIIAQLSDMHIKTADDPIVARWERIIAAIQAEVLPSTKACIIAFTGDITFGGSEEQFEIANMLLEDLVGSMRSDSPELAIHLLTVPGNHDCDLTSEDQEAREALRATIGVDLPAGSIVRTLLAPQRNYFAFARGLSIAGASLDEDSPFYKHHDISCGDYLLRFHLLNSAWTSLIHERDDLLFPLELFEPPESPEAQIAISMIHHPPHWFNADSVRRAMRDKLDELSEMILTGHEHENESTRRLIQGVGEVNHIEGGVLQDPGDDSACSFNMIQLELDDGTQLTRLMSWAADHFEPAPDPDQHIPILNPNRADRRFRLQPRFEEWLNEIDDPVNHPRINELHLSHLFAYPDLRKLTPTDQTAGDDGNTVIDRVRSETVATEIGGQERTIITGDDRSGKTSLCKQLYLDLRKANKLPVYLPGRDINRSGAEAGFREKVARAIGNQYAALSPAEFEQIADHPKTLIIDDFQDGPEDLDARLSILKVAADRFEQIILVAGDDFTIELLNQPKELATALMPYQRYEICEFGYKRLEHLTHRWMTLGVVDPDQASIRESATELCERVQKVLSLAGLPHAPWLLLVVLEQSDQAESPFIAARNGNYGHWYHAVITGALSRSSHPQFDLSGKFIYLAGLAHEFHSLGRDSMSQDEYRSFHQDHCERYGLPFDCGRVRDDLVSTRMLRDEDNRISFRSRWLYCFFMAWWLNRNLRTSEARGIVEGLTTSLHEEAAANILVFLAHFADDPFVLESMRAAAARLFEDAPATELDADVQGLNALDVSTGKLSLPETPPEVNRQLLQDARDERQALRRTRPEASTTVSREDERRSGKREVLCDIRACLKTIQILGQVLQNGATSLEEDQKYAILSEAIGVGRRLLGFIYQEGQAIQPILRGVQHRAFRMLVEKQRDEAEGSEASSGGEEFRLSMAQCRELWKDAGELSRRFWFSIHWTATAAVVKRIGTSVGMPLIDGTMQRLRENDDVLPNHLVDLSVRLHRRSRKIPVDELVRLHKDLERDGNRVGKVVLELMCRERLVLFETDNTQLQAICQQMGFKKVPVKALDPTPKRFARRGRGVLVIANKPPK